MCAACGLINMPICSSGIVCNSNILEFFQMFIVTTGVSFTSVIMWLKNKPKK